MNTQRKIWQRLLPGVVVIAITVVFFVVFMINNNKRVTVQNGNYVSDAADQTASRIADNLYTAVRFLSNISEICTIEEGNAYPEDLKRIDNSIFSIIDYVAVDDTKTVTEGGNTYFYGTLHGFREGAEFTRNITSNPNETGEYTFSKTFMLGMQMDVGEAGMLEEFSNVTSVKSSMMSFYTAVHDGEDKIGVLIGRYDENKMKGILEASFFEEPSGVFLLGSDGSIITTTDEHFSPNEGASNIFDLLRDVVADDTLAAIESCISNGFGEEKRQSFDFSYGAGIVNACMVQLPLENGVSADNWIILQTFPATVTTKMQRDANLEGLQLGLGLFTALAIYIGIILILGYFQNKKLVKANTEMTYVVDGLAKLYDRFIYVNLNEKRYRYIGNTYPDGCEIPQEGDYDDFKAIMLNSFVDDYEKTDLTDRLEIDGIKRDMSDGTAHLRYEYMAKGSKTRWDDLSLICLSRDENGAKEVLFARQNISELKEKELHNQLVLREAFRAAEDANRAKSDFLSTMSHDIRTPMNAVLGFSALIEQSIDKPDKVAEYNKKIQSAGQHLIGLINDLLDMSKIESGKFTLNVSKFSMEGLLDEITSVMVPQAKDRGHSFNVSMDEALGSYLGDKLRISQILINLISNAIKYTPEGGQIDFTVKAGEKLSGNIEGVVFVVKDNGIGMSEEFQKKIFMPFEREERAMTRKVQGTGLGMAITKNLIDLMGGTIELESKENVGTTFTIVLHLVKALAEQPVQRPTSDINPLDGMSILIAEDNEINAEIIGDLLDIEGAKCEFAENGKIAVQMFEQSHPGKYNLILMDVQMPVMNGYAATRAIRESSHPEAKTIPIVAMTANAFAEDVKNALDSGMNAHLSKPVSIDAIKATVEQIINKNK
ncbi:MAG: response regulator [Clostridiales bacterium]|nr:response regulator [Clostridiales bacterium]